MKRCAATGPDRRRRTRSLLPDGLTSTVSAMVGPGQPPSGTGARHAQAPSAPGFSLDRTGHRADIQGLRGLAVLLVVLYHAGVAFPGGYVGVDVFFVVSGYVITRMLLREHKAHGRIDLKRFYLRRIRRLLPALALLLVVVSLVSILASPVGGQRIGARTGVAAAFFSANVYLATFSTDGYFDTSAELNPFLHTWSLAVEEQFYLVFPALLLGAIAMGQRLRPERAVAVAVGVVSAVSFVGAVAMVQVAGSGLVDDPRSFAFYMMPLRAWEFGVGALLAVMSWRPGTRVGGTLAAVGAVAVIWTSVAFDAATVFPGLAAVPPVLGTALLIVGGNGDHVVGRALSVRPMTWLGDVSYSWYLWHWPAIVFAKALAPESGATTAMAAGAFALVPAVASLRLIEEPFRHRAHVRVSRTVALGAVCVLAPVVPAVALEAGALRVDERHDLTLAFTPHADVELGCDGPILASPDFPEACRWPAPGSTGTAVLFGDSNAGHLTEPFVAAAADAGLDAVVTTRSGCAPVDLVIDGDAPWLAGCRVWLGATMDALVTDPPDIVVLAGAADLRIAGYEGDLVEITDPASGAALADPVAIADAWRDGLERVVDRLTRAGISVVIVHPVPKAPGWDPEECAAVRYLVDQDSCAADVGETYADVAHIVRDFEQAVAAEREDVVTVDLWDAVCPDEPCRTRRGDQWLFRDGTHLSIEGSMVARAPLAAALREVG